MTKTWLGAAFATAMAVAIPLSAQAVDLRVLEWEGYISQFKDGFEAYAKQQGKDIKLVFPTKPDGKPFYISTPDDIFEYLREDKADVVTPTINYYQGEKGKLLGLLHPVDASKLSNMSDVYPQLQNLDAFKKDGKVYGVPLLGGSYALAYNADKVSEPDSWTVLFDDKAKNRFTITGDQIEANIYQMALMAGVKPEDVYDYDKYTPEQQEKVAASLNKLVGNAKGFWGGMPYPDDMKDLDYVTDYWFGVAAANQAGQNWKFANPKEGVTVWLDTIALAKSLGDEPEKLEAAYMLVDYMIGVEAQTAINKAFGSVIVNGKAREALGGNLPGAEFFRAEYFWQPLSPRTRNGFRAMWDKAVEASGKQQ